VTTNGTPPTGPWWDRWMAFRRIATFLLGMAVILDSLIEKNTPR
jgi:hypothetical protein